MPARHLFVDAGDRLVQVEMAFLRADLPIKHDLEKQVPKLVAKIVPIFRLGGLDYLISFFDQHRAERRVILLAIPGAAVRRAQSRHHIEQVLKCSFLIHPFFKLTFKCSLRGHSPSVLSTRRASLTYFIRTASEDLQKTRRHTIDQPSYITIELWL